MTAIPTGNYANVQMRWLINGIPGSNDFLYWFQGTPISGLQASAFANQFVAEVWTANLENELSVRARLQEVFVRTGQLNVSPDPTEREYTLVLNTPGAVTGDVLPARVTAVMARYPDNTEVYTDGTPINFDRTYYRNAFSGVPESSADGEVLDDAFIADMAAVFESFETITLSGNVFDLMISRKANTLLPGKNNPPMWCRVAETDCLQKSGSQNTRKS